MSDTTLRLTGRPKIEKDPSGLRKITRTYVVQGSSVTEGRIEDEVFLPYGTPDAEYDDSITQDLSNGGLTNSEVTGAYLVDQQIAPGQTINEAILTRVYQELDSTPEPVQIGKDQIVRSESDRLTLSRVFIVKNPYTDHYGSGRIGVASVTIKGSELLLGTVKSEETQVYTQFTEVYYEEGILSESVDYKYGQYPNHKLEIRTLRSVSNPTPPSNTEGPGTGPWFRVGDKEGPGNRDYGQIGKTIQTTVFAKGEGLISKQALLKGKPPNTVEVTTIKYLTGEDGVVPASEIPAFTRRTEDSKEEKDGYELHTVSGIVVSTGSGVVDVQVTYKHGEKPDHKLEVAKAVSYGVPATSSDVLDFVYPSGDTTSLGNYVIVDEREDTKGEFDVFTTTFARGLGTIGTASRKVGMTTVSEITSLHPSSPVLSTAIAADELSRKVEQLDGYQKLTVSKTTEDSGVVERKTRYQNNEALEIITIMQLGSAWDSANTPTGFAMVEDRSHRYDIYPAITRVYARGTGVIGQSSKKVGQTTVTETTTLHLESTQLSSSIQGNELSRSVRQEDGYQVLVVSESTQDSGVVDQKTDERNNGALVIKNITQLGSVWNAANTPSGYTEISLRNHRYDIYPAITKVYAKGVGEVNRSIKKVGLTEVTDITTLHLESDVISTTISGNELKKDIRQEDGYQVVTVSETSGQSGVVDERITIRHNGALEIKQITQLGNAWSTSVPGYVMISDRQHTYDVYPAITREYAKGNGIISKGYRKVGATTIESIVSLHDTYPTPPTDALKHEITEESGHYKMSYEMQDQNSDLVDVTDESRAFDDLEYRRMTLLGEAWDAQYTPLGYVEISSRTHTYQDLPAITKEFVKGDGEIRSSVSESERYTKTSKTLITPFENPPQAYYPVDATNINIQKKEGYTQIDYDILTPNPQNSTKSSWSTGLFTQIDSELNNFPNATGSFAGSSRSPIDSKNFIGSTTGITAGVYNSLSTSFKRGIMESRSEIIKGDATFSGDGHAYQIADDLYRVASSSTSPTFLTSFSTSYSGGVVRTTTEGVQSGSSISGADYSDFAAVEAYMISAQYGIERKTSEDMATYSRSSTSYGKYTNKSSTTALQSDGSIPSVQGLTGSSVDQIGAEIFRVGVDSETKSGNGGDSSVTYSNGGAVIVKKSTSLQANPSNIADNTGATYVNDLVGYEVETTEFEAGSLYETTEKVSNFVTVSSTSSLTSGDPGSLAKSLQPAAGGKNDEYTVEVRQLAPGIYKGTQTIVKRNPGNTLLNQKIQHVNGGTLFTESYISDNALKPGAGGFTVSESLSSEVINGVQVQVRTITYFVPVGSSYWTLEMKPFTFPGVAGLNQNGIYHIPGYRGVLPVRTNHYINTGGTINAQGTNYTPPSASVGYNAVPVKNAAAGFADTQNFRNCELGTSVAGGKMFFKGKFCNVTVNTSGDGQGSTTFNGINMGSDSEVIGNYGSVKVFHMAIHTSQ